MNAEVVSVGTELLLGQIVDTNAALLGRMLAEVGVANLHRQTVGDNLERVTRAVAAALARADVVITIGGLGPTEDDLTRDGVAAALGDKLIHDPDLEAELREIFARRNFPWLETQLRQAKRPANSRPLSNPNGTAPGLICEKGGKVVICLPGPPAELGPMVENFVKPYLAEKSGSGIILSRVIRIIGLGESVVESKVKDLLVSKNPTIAPLAHTGEVHLRVTARAANHSEAAKMIEPLEAEVRRRLGQAVYGCDTETLEGACIELLRQKSAMVAVAESCTGGMLGARLTSIPGSSDVVVGGAITYANSMKVKLAGVTEETLVQHGAVSAECAKEMALGVKELCSADFTLSVTGIAGPGGGSAEKPVGLVYIGVAAPGSVEAFQYSFPGSREVVRQRSVQAALFRLREALLAAE
ncbi:MAG: putative competence-damage inducible protein [Fimbriimonadaceae bacterium]|nr:putative competence-damage inducible protein [Fimbriimonadaceae bacterium]